MNLVNVSKNNYDGDVALTEQISNLVNSFCKIKDIAIEDCRVVRGLVNIPFVVEADGINILLKRDNNNKYSVLPVQQGLFGGVLTSPKPVFGGACEIDEFSVVFTREQITYMGLFFSSIVYGDVPTSIVYLGGEEIFIPVDEYAVGSGTGDYKPILRKDGTPLVLNGVSFYYYMVDNKVYVYDSALADYIPVYNVDGEITLRAFEQLSNNGVSRVLRAIPNSAILPVGRLKEMFIYCESKLL